MCLPLAQPEEWDEHRLHLPNVKSGILVSGGSNFSTPLAPQGHQNAAIYQQTVRACCSGFWSCKPKKLL